MFVLPIVAAAAAATNVAVIAKKYSDAKKEAEEAKIILEKSRRPPDDKIQLCRECSHPNFNQELATVLDHRQVHVAVMALAGAGKSSFFNNVARALNGRNLPAIRSVGAATVEGGQHSTIISRQNIFEHYLPNWNRQAGCVLFTETVGFMGHDAEQIAIGKGLLKPSEIWSREESNQNVLKRSEILSRNPQAPHVTTFLVLISIQDLWNGSAEHDRIVKSIIETAKTKFEINGMPVEVPVMIAITKCDEHTTNPHYNNLLGQRNSDNLAPIFKKATARFGIPQDYVIALGWQDESDETDWSFGSQDPRAMIVRHTLYQLTTSAAFTHRAFEALYYCSSDDDNNNNKHIHRTATNNNLGHNNVETWLESDRRTNHTQNTNPQQQQQDDTNENEDHDEDFNLPSVSQVNDAKATTAAFTAASLAKSVSDVRAKLLEFEAQVKNSGVSCKEFISHLDHEQLVSTLRIKGVAEPILRVIVQGEFNGSDFVDDDFVEDALLDEKVAAANNINKVHMKSFIKIRGALLEC